MSRKKIRIGLLLDSIYTEAWMYEICRKIQQSNYAEIVLAVINDSESFIPQKNRNIFAKIKKNRGKITYLAVRKILEVLYSSLIERHIYLPDALERRDLEELINSIPTIYIKPVQKKWSDYFKDDDLDKISEHHIDIFIRAGFRILRGKILNTSKYGIWSYHHGDNYTNRGGPAGFWESMENWPETGSVLQILTEDLDNGKILYRSFSCTNDLSVSDNRNNIYWKSVSFIMRKIKELYNKGEERFFEQVDRNNQHPVLYCNRLYVKPTNLELTKLTLSKIIKKIKLLFNNKFFFDQWILAFDLKNEFSSSLWRYKKIIPPKDRFWADPHVIFKDNKYYIFIEEFIYKTNKGHISLIMMDETGKYDKPIVIMNESYHLSYPFVFEYDNEFYMIPETCTNRKIGLYKCTDFPLKWEWQFNIMEDIDAVDATIYFYNEKWWMFVNINEIAKSASYDDELFLFFCDNPFDNKCRWVAHPQNPIISDCKLARPAGKIFEYNGALYRPSQNCSQRYGYGFNISHIDILNENEYKETLVTKVEPNWERGVVATHTFNRVNSIHIIDCQIKRSRFSIFKN